jgi:hypothetical protein
MIALSADGPGEAWRRRGGSPADARSTAMGDTGIGDDWAMAEALRSLSDLVADAQDDLRTQAETLSVSDLLDIFHERGFGFLLFLFALPAALPLPGLGVNFIIAAPLIFLTSQQALGRRTIWFPSSVKAKQIGRNRLIDFLGKAAPWMRRLERLIRPRLGFVTQGIFSNLIGLCGLLMALSVLVPLPLTNTVPSMGIALMALGIVMRDGLAVIAGMTLGLAWIAMLIGVTAFFGAEGVEVVKTFVRDLLP